MNLLCDGHVPWRATACQRLTCWRNNLLQGPAERLTRACITFVSFHRFPDSESSAHFWANLRDGRDMVTLDGRRWPAGLHNTPPRFGKLIEFDRFDASFFSVHGKQAQVRSDCSESLPVQSQHDLPPGCQLQILHA